MKMIDVSKVRVFRGSLFVLFMLFMRIGWASNDDSTYNIVDFGAKGDGITDNTQFINRTIEACTLRGGGTVIIPEGTFLTGSILLKSKVNLFLESNAVVKGINNLEKYRSISDLNQDEAYYKVKPRNWNKALLLGDQVEGVFQEKLFKFPGFYIQRRTIRQYTYDAAGHALGDIGEVSKKDIEADNYYIRGDYIGKQGIEKSYEKYLRGEKGVEILLRDAHGRIQGHYMDGKLDRPSVPGKNLTLGIDIELQRLGERLLQHKIGAIVAIEPATGEILCMVSSPTFDPHLMIGRQRGKNHRMLQRDKRKPLLNRAIMGAYPPGSTFKTAQALTFLQEGIIHEDYPTFPCAHGFNYGSLHVGCHGHGSPLPLVPAIATSCNSYFCWGLFRMFSDKKYGSPQNAITVWKDHMVSQGFGYRLGTDLPGEQRGLIPNAKFYDKAYRGSWNGLTVISIAIGQGEILATPLQIANLGATIANRGHFITPHVVKEIQDNELDSIYRTPRVTSIDREYYDEVVEGMRAAVTGSTGSATCRMVGTILPGVEACGKTGTAQNRGKDHSVFMGFAPMNDPKIAIAVYVENGGFGATYGVPIGAMMMDQYLHGKLSPENEIRAEEFSNRVILYGDEER